MPGGGTSLDTLRNSQQPFCLDVTRLVRRTGQIHTGVDRVEWAYLRWLLTLDRPVFGLMRSAFGYILLDRAGLSYLQDRVRNADWPKPDVLSRLALKLSAPRRGAEAALRRRACARATPRQLSRTMARHFPDGVTYFNVGHSNLTRRVLSAFRDHPNAQTVVLIHDLIPLQYPQFQRDGTVDTFERKMRNVSQLADAVICNSQQTADDVSELYAAYGRVPPSYVAHLGIEVVEPGGQIPTLEQPYVVTVGTIEPRKNHALLLDTWEDWAKHATPPYLVICGKQGWNTADLMDRMDRLIASGIPIIHLDGLDDPTMLSVVKDAKAALFPSLAEGFGLPQIEAAHLGVPLICTDLAIYREVLGTFPVYAQDQTPYSWRQAIEQVLRSDNIGRTGAEKPQEHFVPPDWSTHFNYVLKQFG